MAETELKNQESQAQNGKSPEASPEKNKEARCIIHSSRCVRISNVDC